MHITVPVDTLSLKDATVLLLVEYTENNKISHKDKGHAPKGRLYSKTQYW